MRHRRLRLRCGALEQESVDERLREVAAELSLQHVELFRQQARRSARGAVPFEPARRTDSVSLLRVREREEKTAEEERALRFAERSRVRPVAVGEPVFGQLVLDCAQRCEGAGIVGLYRAFGYQDCSPFGDYKDDPLSLFMTKSLRPLRKIDSEF